ncbi:FMN-binding protein [Serratia marcescens]|nr:FMN-binding protein [Serratia marcescens]
MPPENYDNIMQNECFLVSDPALGDGAPHRLYLARKNGQPTAAALETTAPDGYSGAIKLLVGADFNGTVLGTRVIEHHETPGLGTKSNCAFPTGFPSSAARKSKARTISAGR